MYKNYLKSLAFKVLAKLIQFLNSKYYLFLIFTIIIELLAIDILLYICVVNSDNLLDKYYQLLVFIYNLILLFNLKLIIFILINLIIVLYISYFKEKTKFLEFLSLSSIFILFVEIITKTFNLFRIFSYGLNDQVGGLFVMVFDLAVYSNYQLHIKLLGQFFIFTTALILFLIIFIYQYLSNRYHLNLSIEKK